MYKAGHAILLVLSTMVATISFMMVVRIYGNLDEYDAPELWGKHLLFWTWVGILFAGLDLIVLIGPWVVGCMR